MMGKLAYIIVDSKTLLNYVLDDSKDPLKENILNIMNTYRNKDNFKYLVTVQKSESSILADTVKFIRNLPGITSVVIVPQKNPKKPHLEEDLEREIMDYAHS